MNAASLPNPPQTLPLLLARAPEAAPAIVSPEGALTYGQLAQASARVAGGLRRLGVAPGDRVAIWLPNVDAWLAVFFACSRIGAIAVAVNTRFRSSELADILGRSRAKVLVFWPAFKQIDFAGILGDCAPADLAHLVAVVAYGSDAVAGDGGTLLGRPVVTYAALADHAPLADVAATGESGCALFTTSGTSSRPKFVLHDQRTLAAHACNVVRAWSLSADSATLLVPPLCGVFGLATTLATLAGGGRLIMSPVWDAHSDGAAIVRHGVTHLYTSDTALAQLLQLPQAPAFARSLQHVGYAAFSPGEADIVARAEAMGVRVAGLYGSSELQALLAAQDSAAPVAERSLGGGYFVSPAAHVRVRDPESGELAAPGETGELEFRAPHSVMCGYFENPEATAKAFTDDGYFRSGDLGYARPDGSFVYLARMGDTLRLGGYLVSPAEIEAVVQECDGVAECQVVGVTM
ncbi:AMP-binding protein, partial [Vineibacter terrae]|uniref:AMP-binding protein n=1 Tax=Vineibacter terrae TaxID=2586908 RepID=UPI002E37ACDE